MKVDFKKQVSEREFRPSFRPPHLLNTAEDKPNRLTLTKHILLTGKPNDQRYF